MEEEGKVKNRMLSARLRDAAFRFQMDTESCEPARREAREMWFLKWKRGMTLARPLLTQREGAGEKVVGEGPGL